MYTGEEAGIDDILAAAINDALLMLIRRPRLMRRNERGPNLGQISPHRLRRKDRPA
jgi:hypothetical protein